jgi:hypothetical protein
MDIVEFVKLHSRLIIEITICIIFLTYVIYSKYTISKKIEDLEAHIAYTDKILKFTLNPTPMSFEIPIPVQEPTMSFMYTKPSFDIPEEDPIEIKEVDEKELDEELGLIKEPDEDSEQEEEQYKDQ